MEPLDAARQSFDLVWNEIQSYKGTIFSEADTRLKIIDRMLHEVLGWPLGSLRTEHPSGTGFVDYKLLVSQRIAGILEAKREGKEFGFSPQQSGRAFLLNGALFQDKNVDDGIEQCIRYSGRQNAELACLTNGSEWVIFRGNRGNEGIDTREGKGFVFHSLEGIRDHFKLFFELLSFESVTKTRYKVYFQEAEGRRVRQSNFRKAVYDARSPQLVPVDSLSPDLDRVLSSFFKKLTADDDPEMLDKCFVVTNESRMAEERLIRVTDTIMQRIKSLDTDTAERLTELIDRVKETQRHEFVLIIGTKGAGKSTFIHRFFRTILPKQIAQDCVYVRLNLADSDGNEKTIIEWLNLKLLEKIELEVFKNRATFDDIKGTFYGHYLRLRDSTLKPLYDKDPQQFDIEFGRSVEKLRQEDPHEYVLKLIGNIVRSRKKVPCLVFDNADYFTHEFQERIIQYARSIFESQICMVIIPITDRTSWQLGGHGVIESFENDILYLPTPSPRLVIEKRIQFLIEKIADTREDAKKIYWLNKGITLNLESLTGFAASLQKIFIETWPVADVIKNLSNLNIRNCLDIARILAISPHVEVAELLKAYIAKSSMQIPGYKILNAVIRGNYANYSLNNAYVHNIYATEDQSETTPLLGLRMLRLLADVGRDKRNRYIQVGQVIQYFEALSIEHGVILSWLEELLRRGLCLSYDPTVKDINEAEKVQLSPAGLQHLYWGLNEQTYMQNMLRITPIQDPETYEQLNNLSRQRRKDAWWPELQLFVRYLINQDAKFCLIQTHQAYGSQSKLPTQLERTLRRIEGVASGINRIPINDHAQNAK